MLVDETLALRAESNRIPDAAIKEINMLEVFKDVTNFYGNNTVYVTDGKNHVQKLEKHNYEITAIKDVGDEIWMSSGVIVAIGAHSELRDAYNELRTVLQHIETELAAIGDDKCPNCGKSLHAHDCDDHNAKAQ